MGVSYVPQNVFQRAEHVVKQQTNETTHSTGKICVQRPVHHNRGDTAVRPTGGALYPHMPFMETSSFTYRLLDHRDEAPVAHILMFAATWTIRATLFARFAGDTEGFAAHAAFPRVDEVSVGGALGVINHRKKVNGCGSGVTFQDW
jgi:hypothetical protein